MRLLSFVSLFGLLFLAGSAKCQLSHERPLAKRFLDAPDPVCMDSPDCSDIPTICHGEDADLARALCPVMCGFCDAPNGAVTVAPTPAPTTTTVTTTTTTTAATTQSTADPNADCVDTTHLNCTELQKDVCNSELRFSLCPKTCDVCANKTSECTDQLIDLQCADLGDPCGTTLGLLACPRFCGVCPDPPTTPTTQPPSPQCDRTPIDGCHATEIVYMIEYSSHESAAAVRSEGNHIMTMVDKYRADHDHVRIGVVVYNNNVTEAIHITDYEDDPDGLKARIASLTRADLKPSGEPDLGKALDYVMNNSFTGARPGATRMVIPIFHSMAMWGPKLDHIPVAARRLKDDCVQIAALVIQNFGSQLREDIIYSIVSTPVQRYYFKFYDFGLFGLEGSALITDLHCPKN